MSHGVLRTHMFSQIGTLPQFMQNIARKTFIRAVEILIGCSAYKHARMKGTANHEIPTFGKEIRLIKKMGN